MDIDIGLLASFGAGLVSFLSPCILPLVPPYLCFLAGTSLSELTADRTVAGLISLSASAWLIPNSSQVPQETPPFYRAPREATIRRLDRRVPRTVL